MNNPTQKEASKPQNAKRDLPDIERETARGLHNDQGSTQQLPAGDRDGIEAEKAGRKRAKP